MRERAWPVRAEEVCDRFLNQMASVSGLSAQAFRGAVGTGSGMNEAESHLVSCWDVGRAVIQEAAETEVLWRVLAPEHRATIERGLTPATCEPALLEHRSMKRAGSVVRLVGVAMHTALAKTEYVRSTTRQRAEVRAKALKAGDHDLVETIDAQPAPDPTRANVLAWLEWQAERADSGKILARVGAEALEDLRRALLAFEALQHQLRAAREVGPVTVAA